MRIATKTFIVVLVCLVGAGLSTSVVFYHYSELESARYQREVSQLALRDTENFRTIISQWFVTIDLFFYEKQGYLAGGIKKQALQMQEVINVVKSYGHTEVADSLNNMSATITIVSDLVGKASILTEQEGKQWNQSVSLMDEKSILIIDDVELTYEAYQAISEKSNLAYVDSNNTFIKIVWLSIVIYLFFVFASWLWASRNIARPVQVLTQKTQGARAEEEGLSFVLDNGSKELLELSESFQIFYDKLFFAKQKSEKRKQELQESLDELNETRLQLVQSEKLASVGQLAAGVAHEINNPIGFIAGNFNTLKTYVDDLGEFLDKQQQCITTLESSDGDSKAVIEEINQCREDKDVDFILSDLTSLLGDSHVGIERVKKIVSDLLEFSHVNAPNLTQVNINELIDKTVNIIDKNRLENISFNKQYQDVGCAVCNGAKLGQALMHILMNAIEAIERKQVKGIILIKTFSQHKKMYIEIQDNGDGISDENLARVFDPFYTTKDIGDGTGLGLHIAQSILDNHDGYIQAISQEGQGTKFRMELPIDPPVDDNALTAGQGND